jgi:hypothetical protein
VRRFGRPPMPRRRNRRARRPRSHRHRGRCRIRPDTCCECSGPPAHSRSQRARWERAGSGDWRRASRTGRKTPRRRRSGSPPS